MKLDVRSAQYEGDVPQRRTCANDVMTCRGPGDIRLPQRWIISSGLASPAIYHLRSLLREFLAGDDVCPASRASTPALVHGQQIPGSPSLVAAALLCISRLSRFGLNNLCRSRRGIFHKHPVRITDGVIWPPEQHLPFPHFENTLTSKHPRSGVRFFSFERTSLPDGW